MCQESKVAKLAGKQSLVQTDHRPASRWGTVLCCAGLIAPDGLRLAAGGTILQHGWVEAKLSLQYELGGASFCWLISVLAGFRLVQLHSETCDAMSLRLSTSN